MLMIVKPLVELSNDGGMYTSNGVQVQFVASARVSGLLPSRGGEGEVAPVVVSGEHFENNEALVCRFGSKSLVSARWRSSTSMVCLAPMQFDGNITVEVSNDGMHFSEDGVRYQYTRVAKLTALSPSKGPVRGGTSVTMIGRALGTHEVRCMFCGDRASGSSGRALR